MKQMKKSSYIGEFDFWKFIFAFIIVMLHSSYLPTNTEEPFFRGGQHRS